MALTFEDVESSMINSVAYDAPQRELHVRFGSGKVYIYADVPAEIHAELMSADSKGSYMRSFIIDCYPTRMQR